MPELILLTGASGYLGSHIALELLLTGYRVRAITRGPKVADLKHNYAKFGINFDVLAISDISTAEFPEAFENVDAVIHSAGALPQKGSPELMLKSIVDGTMNVARQTEKAGIKRLVVTSSIATVINPALPPPEIYTDKDWYPIENREQALAGSKMDAYRAAKTLAEKELWAFGEAHPHLDITTLNPPYLYGPFAPTFPLPPPGDYHALSTPLHIYRLLTPHGPFPPSAGYADVRDIAHAHILALSSRPALSSSVPSSFPPPSSTVSTSTSTSPTLSYSINRSRLPPRKRLILASPHPFIPPHIINLIRLQHPELAAAGRVTTVRPPRYEKERAGVDLERVEEVLGMGREMWRGVEETVLDTVESLVGVERRWRERGWEGVGEEGIPVD